MARTTNAPKATQPEVEVDTHTSALPRMDVTLTSLLTEKFEKLKDPNKQA